MIASSSHSLTFFFQSVKMSYINSAFQNLFIRCHRLPKSISWWGRQVETSLGSPGRQVVTRVCHDLGGVTHWPIEKSILPSIAATSLQSLEFRPLKKWMVFQWVVSYPLQSSPHLKCQENQHAKNQRNHKVHHVPTWHFAANATPMVCFFYKTKRIWKLKSIR